MKSHPQPANPAIPCLNDEFLRELGWSVVAVFLRMEQMRHESLKGHLYYFPEERRDLGLRLLGFLSGDGRSAEQHELLLTEIFGGQQGVAKLMALLDSPTEGTNHVC